MKTLLLAVALVQFGSLDAPVTKGRQHVAYASEAQTVTAGKRSELLLRFQIDRGFHVNSHTPKSDLLIPTRLELHESDGVKAGTTIYPAGSSLIQSAQSTQPSETLDVYSDEFVLHVPVTATPGPHELKGELKYQACTGTACFPARGLPVDIVFTAR